jgi:hypothetical protein
VVEASLLVADARQRQGIATFVLAEVARPRWAGWTVHATVQPENAALVGCCGGSGSGGPGSSPWARASWSTRSRCPRGDRASTVPRYDRRALSRYRPPRHRGGPEVQTETADSPRTADILVLFGITGTSRASSCSPRCTGSPSVAS